MSPRLKDSFRPAWRRSYGNPLRLLAADRNTTTRSVFSPRSQRERNFDS